MGPVVPKHVVSSQTREQIRVSCIPRGILNQRAAREARTSIFVPQHPLTLLVISNLLFSIDYLLSSFSPWRWLVPAQGWHMWLELSQSTPALSWLQRLVQGCAPVRAHESPWQFGYFGIAGSKFCFTTPEATSYGGHLIGGGPKNEDKRRRAELG